MRIGNTKLANSIVKRLQPKFLELKDSEGNTYIERNVTNKEFDLFMYLALRQDPFGKVEGIYYKDLMIEIDVCKQTFYDTLNGLERKQYIKVSKFNADYFDVQILNNKFADKKDDEKGYININRAFLHSWSFKRLKVNEKKIILWLLMSYKPSTGLKIYPQKIAKMLDLKTKSMTLIYNYIENIKEFFPYSRIKGEKGDLVYFHKGNDTIIYKTQKTDREQYLEHKIKHICRIFKISYTMKDLKDLIILIGQYAAKGIGKVFSIISDVLIKKRSIEPKLINSYLSDSYKNKKELTLEDWKKRITAKKKLIELIKDNNIDLSTVNLS